MALRPSGYTGVSQHPPPPGIGLPKSIREAMGYWRGSATCADSKTDKAALSRAITTARERRGRIGRLADMSDRYASVFADSVEQDITRATCMLAAREQMRIWGDLVPESRLEQIRVIGDANLGAVQSRLSR